MRWPPSSSSGAGDGEPLYGWLSFGFAVSMAGACITSSPGDRSFKTGDYARAAEAYESRLENDEWLGRKDRVLYRLALIYASAESPLEDRDRARALLQQLLDDHPDSPYRLSALLILELQRTLAGLRELASREDERIDALLQELAELQTGSDRLEEVAGSRENRIRELTRRVHRLQSEVERLATEVAEREAELRRIKEIDLAKPP